MNPTTIHPLKDVLRETAELKKLNAGLMKTTEIDDLLGDTYGMIWREIGTRLKQAATPAPAHPVSTSPPRPDTRDVMSLSNLMHVDGASEIRPSSAHHGSTSQLVSPYMSRPATPPPHTANPTTSTSTPLQEMTPGKPKSRVISRREMIKRASDTVASLKPTASTVAAAATANKTGSPAPPDNVGRRNRRDPEVEDTNISIVMETSAGDSDVGEGDVDVDVEGEGGKRSGTASHGGSAHERDGNDADDESGSDVSGDEEGDEVGEQARPDDDGDVTMGTGEARSAPERSAEVVVSVMGTAGFSGANSSIDVDG